MLRFPWQLIVTITVWLLILTRLDIECKENCYYVSFLKTNWTDDRPGFEVNMTFSNQTGITTRTTMLEDIADPVSSIVLVEYSNKEKPRTLYNVTTKLCDLHGIVNAVPLFKPVKENMLKQSNYTFTCPLAKGYYVMNNMHISPKNPVLSIMYQPKRTFTVQGRMYEELPNGKIHLLTKYFMKFKILKKVCSNDG